MPDISHPPAADERDEFEEARDEAGLSVPAFVMAPDGLPMPDVPHEVLEDESLPPTLENLICQACLNYCAVLTSSQDLGGGRQLRRYCTRLQAGSELMELTEACVFACDYFELAEYNPLGVDLDEAREIVARSSVLLEEAHRTLAKRASPEDAREPSDGIVEL